MDLRQKFRKKNPDFPLLELTDPRAVEDLMAQLGWLAEGEVFVACSRAGEGNMNLTLRVLTSERSVIVKQSRPWVEKYDQVAAPLDRALVEKAFYERVAAIERVAERMPRLLGADAPSRCLLLEDLGETEDLSSLFASAEGGALAAAEAEELGGYLRSLHGATRGAAAEALSNREMRALNHAHIFEIPLQADNGIDLEVHETGLTQLAATLRGDGAFTAAVARLAERYLADGPCLLHGDFFPGSWLRAKRGSSGRDGGTLFVIDPEFCFYGDPEFDLGVAAAHLALARQPRSCWDQLLAAARPAAPAAGFDEALLAGFAGTEVMRRLLGVAQLPLPPSTGWRAAVLQAARRVVLEGHLDPLYEASLARML